MTQPQQQPQRPDELTPEEVVQIIEEINAWVRTMPHPEEWQLYCFSHLHDMPIEAYLVTYKDGFAHVFFRHEDGKLEPALTLTYWAPDVLKEE